jgi:hypothetical protein
LYQYIDTELEQKDMRMDPFLVGLLGLYIALSLGVAIWSLSIRGTRAAQRASRRAGLTLPDEPLRGSIGRRVLHTLRWSNCCAAVGALLGVAACVIAVTTGVPIPENNGIIWLAFAGFILGGSVGAVLAVLTAQAPDATGRPRIARAARRELGDYLDPFELNGARAAAVLGSAIAVATLIQPSVYFGFPPTVTILLAITGLIAWAILELGGRYVVLSRPRIVESEAELAWDDAFRAADLRRLVTAVLMPSCYAIAFGGLPLFFEVANPVLSDTAVMVLANVSFYVFLAIASAILVVALRRDPEHHYLRRLWPDLAPQNTAAAANARVAAAQAEANARATAHGAKAAR